MKELIISHRLKLFILIQILISTYWNRRWLQGLYTTLKCSLYFHFNRAISSSSSRYFSVTRHKCADGEEAVIYNLRKNDTKDVWIILPGGMTHGDKFYVHDCLSSGVLGDRDDVLVFHNPGIANKVKRKAPPALTDTTYIEEYVRYLVSNGRRVSLIGFSAGGMLAIAATKLRDINAKDKPLVRRVVAVHCPDRIRDVFETHQSGWIRLDRIFALSLFLTMWRSGSSKVLSRKRGGGFGKNPLVLPSALMFGWSWMKRFTEKVFQRHWYDMEADLWSCRDAMTKPVKTPLLRIISRNDPIVWTRNCVDPALFCNISKVIVQNNGGHCAAFVEKSVIDEMRAWCDDH